MRDIDKGTIEGGGIGAIAGGGGWAGIKTGIYGEDED